MVVCDACAQKSAICTEEVASFTVRVDTLTDIQVSLCKGCRDHLRAAIRHYIGLGPEKVRF